MRNRFTAFALILIAIVSAACESSANEEQSENITGDVVSVTFDTAAVPEASEPDIKPEAITEESTIGTVPSKSVTVASEPGVKPETITKESTIETVPRDSVTEASAAEPESEDKCEYEWQHAYAEYIDQMFFYYGLYIDDINGDDIPEAVIEVNPFGYTTILYYTENGLAELELAAISDWGSVSYLADTKQILFCPFHGHTWGTFGNEEYYLYDWTGTEYTVSASIYRESGTFVDTSDRHIEEYGQAYIDGEKVDNDTFEIKLAEFMELEQNNGYFPAVELRDEDFESYAKEKLPDFKMPEFDYGQYIS